MTLYEKYLKERYEVYCHDVIKQSLVDEYYHNTLPIEPLSFEDWQKLLKKEKRKKKYFNRWRITK